MDFRFPFRFGSCFLFLSFIIFITYILKQLTISNNTCSIDSLTESVLLPSSAVSASLSSGRAHHLSHQMFTLLLSVEICGFHLIYHLLHMVIASSPPVLPSLLKGFLSNFYHVIELYGDDDDYVFSFNDVLIHEGHLCQNVILLGFGIETA